MFENLDGYDIILASKSPRRKQLISSLGLDFRIETKNTEEVFPDNLPVEKVAGFLAKLKADAFRENLTDRQLIITADTVVRINNELLGKPADYNEAFNMLSSLSGKTHQVTTGVYLLSRNKEVLFSSNTDVHFKTLSEREIDYYISHFKPFDKAGAYGIQEWIGFIGVESIQGSYFNVMGLPVQRLYVELGKF